MVADVVVVALDEERAVEAADDWEALTAVATVVIALEAAGADVGWADEERDPDGLEPPVDVAPGVGKVVAAGNDFTWVPNPAAPPS